MAPPDVEGVTNSEVISEQPKQFCESLGGVLGELILWQVLSAM